jgi:hypothetical protein
MIWIAFVAFTDPDRCNEFAEYLDQKVIEVQCVLVEVEDEPIAPIRPRLRPQTEEADNGQE